MHQKHSKAIKAIIRLFVRNLIRISFWTMCPNPVSPEIFAGSHPGLSFGQGHTAYCSGQSSKSTGSAQKLSQTRLQGVPGRRSPAKKKRGGMLWDDGGSPECHTFIQFRVCNGFPKLYGFCDALCGLTSAGETLRRWPHWLLSPWGFLIPAIRSGRAVFNRELVKRQSMSKYCNAR